MSISKAWQWEKEKNDFWLYPSEESFFISHHWKEKGFKDLLDYGCGLGRHSVYFAKQDFNVTSFDLSEHAINYLKNWSKKEKLNINLKITDMIKLPFKTNSFDCIFAYHVISHTDSKSIKKIIAEINRVLKPNGEIFLSLCSKDTWSFKDSGYPKIDENTIIKTDEGSEKGIPHFYVNLEETIELFKDFNILKIRHTDDCFFNNTIQNSKHYFILAKKNSY